jgi:hypothetical protein
VIALATDAGVVEGFHAPSVLALLANLAALALAATAEGVGIIIAVCCVVFVSTVEVLADSTLALPVIVAEFPLAKVIVLRLNVAEAVSALPGYTVVRVTVVLALEEIECLLSGWCAA